MNKQLTNATDANDLQQSLNLVEANTEEQWAKDALEAIRQVCATKDEFICDDVWATGLRSTHNDKALGPVMMRAKRMGLCEKTNRVRPSLRSHLSGKPVWVSKLRNNPKETNA